MWVFLTVAAVLVALSWPYFIAAYALYKRGLKKGARQERQEQEEMLKRVLEDSRKE
ncbi:MAG: hypothetical protein IKF29_00565 [Oceanobacillus sp.]|nr:hypothetical protein [Oceanobacillus sp.]